MPKVSIIVPNYNHGKFIGQRLQSIFNQTYQDFEVLLLDDCSTDNSREIIDSYSSHPKVTQVILSENNSGSPYVQWHKGITRSRGQYIWIAESDDFADPVFLETAIAPLERDESVVISHCQSWRVDESGEILFSCSDWLGERWKTNFQNAGIDEFYDYGIYSHGIFNASAVVFSKSAFNKISHEFLNYRFVGDDVMWCEIMWQGDIVYNAKNLNYFRIHDHSSSRKLTREGTRLVEGYKSLNYYQSVKNCSKKSSFKKKLNYLAGIWSRDIISLNFDKKTSYKIFVEAKKADKLLMPRLFYYLSNFLVKKLWT
jgi:glycosyltransferase involved in cell wall biosynthesis